MASIKWKGRDLGEWRGKPSLKECRKIKAELGLGPEAFQEAFEALDADAWSMLVAIMLNRNGEKVNFEDVDGDYDDFELVLSNDERTAVDESAQADAGKAQDRSSESEPEPQSSTPASTTSTD